MAIVLALAGIAAAIMGWRRRRSARAVLRGLAVTLLAAGAWITGFLALASDAARGLWEWLSAQQLNTRMWIGLGLVIVAVLLFIISSAMEPVGRAEGRRRREERGTNRAGTPTGRPGLSDTTTAPSGQQGDTNSAGTSTAEDAEITAILDRHGIH